MQYVVVALFGNRIEQNPPSQTWFVGSTFRKVAGLTERGLMVEIKYNKDAMVDCRLVSLQPGKPQQEDLASFDCYSINQYM